MGSAEFWTRFGIIITLVLLGGVFAGKYFHQLHLKSALSRVGHGGWFGLGWVRSPCRQESSDLIDLKSNTVYCPTGLTLGLMVRSIILIQLHTIVVNRSVCRDSTRPICKY
jgi:hypothetical protein